MVTNFGVNQQKRPHPSSFTALVFHNGLEDHNANGHDNTGNNLLHRIFYRADYVIKGQNYA